MEGKCQAYQPGEIHPSGMDCQRCPHFIKAGGQPAKGDKICKKCRAIYVCSVEKKQHQYCLECSKFPCSKFEKFSEKWKKYDQDLIEVQQQLKSEINKSKKE